MNSIITEFNVRTQPAAIRAWVKDRMILIELSDFSIVAFLADSFRLLKNAAEEQLWNVEIRLNGIALR
ncbi:MAG: hypothetical protein QG635_1999 [Bacteroidota bacterium]|nr:hypothetical protein [Bacteroidota bacterium]